MRRFGPLSAEIVSGEGDRYTSSLVLLHGLWESPALWRRFMGYLAHRGWHCIAPDLRELSHAHGDLDEARRRMAAAIGELDAPPILIGHDLGAVLALHLGARAVVALAPLVQDPLIAAPGFLSLLRRRLNRPLLPPRPWRGRAYGRSAPRERVSSVAVARISSLVDRLGGLTIPTLVLVGANDPVLTAKEAQWLARRVGAEVRTRPGGHALPVDEGWPEVVSDIHRWLIRSLGEPLLVYHDDDE